MSDLSNLLGNVYSGEADGRSVTREPAANLRNTGVPALDDDLAAALSAAIVEASAPGQPVAAPAPPVASPEFPMPLQPQPAPEIEMPRMTAPLAAPAAPPAWVPPPQMIQAPVSHAINWALGDDDIVPGSVATNRGKR